MFLLSSRTIYNPFRDFQCLVIKACLMHKTPDLWQEDKPHAAYYKDCRKDLITEDSHICLEPDVPMPSTLLKSPPLEMDMSLPLSYVFSMHTS